MSGIKCLETRVTPDGIKRRRYEHPDGTRMSTVEVPLQLWASVCAGGRAAGAKAAWFRKQEMAAKQKQALQLSAAGQNDGAIALQIGVSRRTVSRWTRAKVLERAA